MKPRKNRVRFVCILAACILASNLNVLAQAVSDGKSASTNPLENDKDGVVTLTPFSVTANQETGYGAMQASSGRLGERYIDTPQATSIVTGELMKDAKLVSSFTALKFVPNAAQTQSGHNPGYNIRGVSTGQLFYDGFGIGSGSVTDTAFFDRIEVVKGPATAGYGRGNPAGFINFVSKAPRFTNSTEIQTTFGTGGPVPNQRVALDNNGLVTRDGKTAYRLVSAYTRGSSTKEGSDFERAGIQLAVARQFAKGEVTATLNLYNNKNPTIIGADLSNYDTYERYLSFFYDVLPSHKLFPDADTSLVPDDIGVRETGMVSSVVLNYNLSENWSTRQAINHVDRVTDGTWSGPAAEIYDPVARTGRAFVFRYYSAIRTVSYQSDFLWKHENEATNSKYTLLFGGDYSDTNSQSFRPVANTAATPLFPFNPSLATYSFPVDVKKNGNQTTGSNKSAYAQLTASFLDEKLRLTVAQRKNYFDLTTRSVATRVVSSAEKNSTPVTGTYSVLYKVTPNLSVYATKAEYQEPASVRPLYQGLPVGDPRLSETILVQPLTNMTEFGFKGTLFDEKIAFTVARYKTKNTGSTGYTLLPQVVINGVIVHASVGYENQYETEGWEFEVFGKITKNLTLMVGGGIQDGTATGPSQPDATGKATVLTYNNDPGDGLFGRLKYSFGPSSEVGLALTAGFKTYFKGWTYHYGSTPRNTASLSYPTTETVADFGISYGMNQGKYRIGLARMFHEADFAGSFLFRGLYFVDLARV